MRQGSAPTQTQFREILDEIFNKQSQARIDRELQKTFWGFLQNFIDRMQSGSRIHLQKNTPLSQSTINNVRNLKNHLQEYQRVSRRPIEFGYSSNMILHIENSDLSKLSADAIDGYIYRNAG